MLFLLIFELLFSKILVDINYFLYLCTRIGDGAIHNLKPIYLWYKIYLLN